jgi:hypothetical protein
MDLGRQSAAIRVAFFELDSVDKGLRCGQSKMTVGVADKFSRAVFMGDMHA